jgi:hypothetical protein
VPSWGLTDRANSVPEKTLRQTCRANHDFDRISSDHI